MDGRVGGSLQIAHSFVASAHRLRLSNNEIVAVRISRQVTAGRYTVVIRGATLEVNSAMRLPVGGWVSARVLLSGRRIALRLLTPADMARSGGLAPRPPVALAPGLPEGLSMLILQSMGRSSMPLLPATVAAIAGMLPRNRTPDPELTRFATLVYDKGLRLSPDRLEELFLSVTGRNRGGGGGANPETRQQAGGDNRQSKDAAETAGVAPGDTSNSRVGAGDGRAAAAFRRQLRAQASGSAAAEPGPQLLLNHRTGAHETWIVVPFHLRYREVPVDGSLRILLELPAGSRAATFGRVRVSRVVVDAQEGGSFEILGFPPARVVLHEATGPGRLAPGELLPELLEKLRNLGVEIDDTNNGGAVFDGFGAEDVEIRGIDASV